MYAKTEVNVNLICLPNTKFSSSTTLKPAKVSPEISQNGHNPKITAKTKSLLTPANAKSSAISMLILVLTHSLCLQASIDQSSETYTVMLFHHTYQITH